MKYDRRILEVRLERVELGVTSRRSAKAEAGQHLLSATLLYPRPMIAERTSLKTVAIDDGVADLKKAGLSKRILFKEVIQGPFSIRVDVSEELSDGELGKFLETATTTFTKVARSEATSMAVGAWTAGLIRVPIDHLSKALSAAAKSAPCSVGTGEADVTIDGRWKAGSSGKVRIPLGVEQDVYRLHRVRRGGEMTTRRKKLLSANDENGWVELSLQTYD
jgi:hypothetical protein